MDGKSAHDMSCLCCSVSNLVGVLGLEFEAKDAGVEVVVFVGQLSIRARHSHVTS